MFIIWQLSQNLGQLNKWKRCLIGITRVLKKESNIFLCFRSILNILLQSSNFFMALCYLLWESLTFHHMYQLLRKCNCPFNKVIFIMRLYSTSITEIIWETHSSKTMHYTITEINFMMHYVRNLCGKHLQAHLGKGMMHPVDSDSLRSQIVDMVLV